MKLRTYQQRASDQLYGWWVQRPSIADVRCNIPGPENQEVAAETIKTRKAPISRERGTCPSSRACSRRLDDAGSVFSRSLSSAISGFQLTSTYYIKNL